MILVQSNRKRRIGGEDEFGVALSPVPVWMKIKAGERVKKFTYLITAMFTGAEAVAWNTVHMDSDVPSWLY